MPHAPSPRPAALCALLAVLWHAPLLAQDGEGDAVDLRERGAAAAAEAESAVVATETLLFAFGASDTNARHEAALDALAARLAEDEALRVRVDAHTDNVGWALGNVELSRLRARAVAEEILARGVAVERLEARAFGESRPVASNATVEGRRRNRRVEVSLLR